MKKVILFLTVLSACSATQAMAEQLNVIDLKVAPDAVWAISEGATNTLTKV